MKLKVQKMLRAFRNIIKNLSKIIKNKAEKTAVVNFLSRYKYILIIALILVTFVGKNLYLIGKYSYDIKNYTTQVQEEEQKIKQMHEDLKYYNTDEFVYRYAMSELNMRPTKPSKWVHVKVFPKREEESSNTNSDDASTQDESSNSEDDTTSSNSEDDNSNMNTD